MSKQTSVKLTTLPSKELSLFKRVVKCYEQKQYKMGLKLSKQILSNPKFSEHGETLSMKGLIFSCIGKKEEAMNLVKKGVKNDIKSSICWHVYGLVQKAEHKYDEAMKCYRQALKIDKENIQILRDLSLLQIQMRNFEGHLETRYQLFQLRPSQKASWIGYVVALHLVKNYDFAKQVLEEFFRAQLENPSSSGGGNDPYNYEHSELLLYYSSVLYAANRMTEVIVFVEKHEREIVDVRALAELRGDIFLAMEQFQEAEQIYWSLIDRNPENKYYYKQLEKALRLRDLNTHANNKPAPSNITKLTALYQKISALYPRSTVAKFMPMEFLEGDAFFAHVDSVVRPLIRKGVPPLFAQLRKFYAVPDKRAQLDRLFCSYHASMQRNQTLCADMEEEDADMADREMENEAEPPSTEIWLHYLLAQHHHEMGDTQRGLDLIDAQLRRTPTLIEFYSLRANMLEQSGCFRLAARWTHEAQALDTADRFLNCAAVRLLIKSGALQDALEMAGKFTKESKPAAEQLNEMQCMWYLNERARLELRGSVAASPDCATGELPNLGEALRQCHFVEKHFQSILEDQFDFHSYCLRKCTLNSYIRLLQLEDRVTSHRFFRECVHTACAVYLQLVQYGGIDELQEMNAAHAVEDRSRLAGGVSGSGCVIASDDVSVQQQQENEKREGGAEAAGNSMLLNKAEMKKMRNKARKQKLKAEQEAARHVEERLRQEQRQRQFNAKGEAGSDSAGNAGGGGEANGAEQDKAGDLAEMERFDPDKLARVENPLEEATRKFLLPLIRLSPPRNSTQTQRTRERNEDEGGMQEGGLDVKTQLLAFRLYSKKRRPLLAWKSLWPLVSEPGEFVAILSRHPRVFQCAMKFLVKTLRPALQQSEQHTHKEEGEAAPPPPQHTNTAGAVLQVYRDAARMIGECFQQVVGDSGSAGVCVSECDAAHLLAVNEAVQRGWPRSVLHQLVTFCVSKLLEPQVAQHWPQKLHQLVTSSSPPFVFSGANNLDNDVEENANGDDDDAAHQQQIANWMDYQAGLEILREKLTRHRRLLYQKCKNATTCKEAAEDQQQQSEEQKEQQRLAGQCDAYRALIGRYCELCRAQFPLAECFATAHQIQLWSSTVVQPLLNKSDAAHTSTKQEHTDTQPHHANLDEEGDIAATNTLMNGIKEKCCIQQN